jgi:hypothetical protein
MPESAYEKARRLANESSLSGVDWDQYHDPKFDTLPSNLKPEAFEAEKDANRLKEYFKAFPSAKDPRGNIYHPGDYRQEEIDAARGKVKNAVTKRPFPNGLDMEHTVRYPPFGGISHRIAVHDPSLPADEQKVGSLEWHGNTGHVDWLGAEKDYRVTVVPHMIEAAHAISEAYGHVGPHYAESLSPYSYKLSDKFAPSSIPFGAQVDDIPVEGYRAMKEDPEFKKRHEQALDHLTFLHDELTHARTLIPSYHPAREHLEEAHDQLGYALDAHANVDHASILHYLDVMSSALNDAHNSFNEGERNSKAVQNLQKYVGNAESSLLYR